MITENTKYVSPKDALNIFKAKGIKYITLAEAHALHHQYEEEYRIYRSNRSNIRDIITDICTSLFSKPFGYILDSITDRLNKRKISLYQLIEGEYVKIEPYPDYAGYYTNRFICCEEMFLDLEKNLIIMEHKNNDN